MTRPTVLAIALAAAIPLARAAAQGSQPLAVGAEVPPLQCEDVDGRKLAWSDFLGKAVVVFFHSEQMAYSQQGLREVVAALHKAQDVPGKAGLLLVSNGDRDKAELREMLESSGLQWRLVIDPQRKAFASYHVVAFPTVIMVGTDHTVRAIAKGYGPMLSVKVLSGARLAAGLITQQQHDEQLEAQPDAAPSADLLKLSRTVRMARQLVAAGMLAEARDSLLRVIDASSDHTEGIGLLARTCLQMGQTEEAARWIARLTELAPTSVDARHLRAQLALSQNQPDTAMTLLDGLADDDPEVCLLRGRALEQKGDYRAAAALYRKALESVLHK